MKYHVNALLVSVLLLLAPALSADALIEIHPTGDPPTDAASLMAAIDQVDEHGVIVLGAGTWNIAAPRSDITTHAPGRPLSAVDGFEDYLISSPGGAIQLYDDAWRDTGYHDVIHRQFPVPKSITIRGELDSDGDLITTVTTGSLFSEANFIPTNDKLVRFEDLRFDTMQQAIEVLGGLIEVVNCEFSNLFAAMQFYIDNRSTYPEWPQQDVVRRSLVRDSRFDNFFHVAHMAGSSGVTWEGNHFGRHVKYIGAYPTLLNFFAFPDFYPLIFSPAINPDFMVTEASNDIIVRDNVWDAGAPQPGEFVGMALLFEAIRNGESERNLIEGNRISSYPAVYGVVLTGDVRETVIADNDIEVIHPYSRGITLWGASDNMISGNVVQAEYFGIWTEFGLDNWASAPFPLLAAAENRLFKNVVSAGYLGIYLGAYARDSELINNDVDGGLVDYLLGGHAEYQGLVFGPASGNHIRSDYGADYLDFSGCTKKNCPQIDEDSDGAINEDPVNGLDDDGDGLADEDPETIYNKVLLNSDYN